MDIWRWTQKESNYKLLSMHISAYIDFISLAILKNMLSYGRSIGVHQATHIGAS